MRIQQLSAAGLLSVFGLMVLTSSVNAQTPVTVPDYGFETPVLTSGTNIDRPTGSSWTWTSTAGISTNSSPITGSQTAPEGSQLGYLYHYGACSQSISGFTAGTSYNVTFSLAQRSISYVSPGQTVSVTLDGHQVASITPPSTSFSDYTITFTDDGSTGGVHTLGFTGKDPGTSGTYQTALLDNVRILSVPPNLAANIGWVDNSPTWSSTPSPLQTLNAGGTYYAHVGIINSTQTTWSWSGGYDLWTLNYNSSGTQYGCGIWGLDEALLPISTVVLPGQSAYFNFPITTPNSSGQYPFQWQVGTGPQSLIGPVVSLTSPPYASPAPTTLTVVPYNTDNGSIRIINAPLQMVAGQLYDICLQVYNSGTTTWTPGAGYMLGVVPQVTNNTNWGVTSTFAGTIVNGVQITQDLAALGSPTAAANSIIHCSVLAPSTAGTYVMQWQPMKVVNGTTTNFGTASLPVSISVVSSASTTDNAAYVAMSGFPSQVHGGQQYNVSVTFQNTGTSTWTADQSYRLMSDNPNDNVTFGLSRVELPNTVAPGCYITFNFVVTAPAYNANGNNTYNFQWQIGRECVNRFGNTSPTTQITVTQ